MTWNDTSIMIRVLRLVEVGRMVPAQAWQEGDTKDSSVRKPVEQVERLAKYSVKQKQEQATLPVVRNESCTRSTPA
jgi:hypothetical protein